METRYCTRHPDRETLVSCGRCGRPFCPECLIHTPAGQRCYECAGVRRDAVQRAAATRFFQAAGVSALGAAIGGLLGSVLFILVAALVSGSVVGQILSHSVNRKTRQFVYLAGLLALVAGAILGWTVVWAIRLSAVPAALALPLEIRVIVALMQVAQSWQLWLFVILAAVIGYQRVR